MYELVYSSAAEKDAKKLAASHLKEKCAHLLNILSDNPWKNPPPYEKLGGNLSGYLSRRINLQHRLVYKVYEKEKSVKILRMWTHYD